MPAVISAQAMTVPNEMKLTAAEVRTLIGNIELLRRRDKDEIVFTTDGGKTVRLRRDGVTSIQRAQPQAVADTTWAENNVVVAVSGKMLARFQHALQDFGGTRVQFLFEVPGSNNTIRFTLA